MLSRSGLQTIAVLALLTLFVFSASDFSFNKARHDQIRNVRKQSSFGGLQLGFLSTLVLVSMQALAKMPELFRRKALRT